MEPQKPENYPGPGSQIVERQRAAKERAAQTVCSWTAQNEMRGVLGRMSQALQKDSRFCQSCRDKSLTEGCVLCSVDEREHSERDEGAQVPRWKSREPVRRRI